MTRYGGNYYATKEAFVANATKKLAERIEKEYEDFTYDEAELLVENRINCMRVFSGLDAFEKEGVFLAVMERLQEQGKIVDKPRAWGHTPTRVYW